MKSIYILKEMNEIHLERTYADNRLKRFKTRNVENLSTEQTEIHEMLNIALENSIDAMKKSNNINKDARIDDKIRFMKLFRTSLKAQIQTVRFSKMILQTIIYQIRRFETFVQELNLTLVASIN